MVREKVVRDLMDEAYQALTRVTQENDASGDEVVSAIFSMAKNTIATTRKMGANMAVIRSNVQLILMECHDKGKPS